VWVSGDWYGSVDKSLELVVLGSGCWVEPCVSVCLLVLFGRIRPRHVLLSISNGKESTKTSFDRPPLRCGGGGEEEVSIV
jgi:hypothetical protein